MNKRVTLLAVSFILTVACRGEQPQQEKSGSQLNTKEIERITGIAGTLNNGQFKITIPQTRLNVKVDDFRIIPPMGLTSWAAFTPTSEGAMVMGDLVLLEDEIGPVQQTVVASGMAVTALHNHFVRDAPKVMFMHIHGIGPETELAAGVRSVLDKIAELRTAKGLTEQVAHVKSSFNPEVIENILNYDGAMNAGVYKVAIGRPDVDLLDHGVKVSTFMGFNTWMAFQGTAEKAAVAGDFAMLEHEVESVIETLVSHEIEIAAVHNHMVTEQPRIFFLHFWGVGPVEKLARGLKAGLERTGTPKAPGVQN